MPLLLAVMPVAVAETVLQAAVAGETREHVAEIGPVVPARHEGEAMRIVDQAALTQPAPEVLGIVGHRRSWLGAATLST